MDVNWRDFGPVDGALALPRSSCSFSSLLGVLDRFLGAWPVGLAVAVRGPRWPLGLPCGDGDTAPRPVGCAEPWALPRGFVLPPWGGPAGSSGGGARAAFFGVDGRTSGGDASVEACLASLGVGCDCEESGVAAFASPDSFGAGAGALSAASPAVPAFFPHLPFTLPAFFTPPVVFGDPLLEDCPPHFLPTVALPDAALGPPSFDSSFGTGLALLGSAFSPLFCEPSLLGEGASFPEALSALSWASFFSVSGETAPPPTLPMCATPPGPARSVPPPAPFVPVTAPLPAPAPSASRRPARGPAGDLEPCSMRASTWARMASTPANESCRFW